MMIRDVMTKKSPVCTGSSTVSEASKMMAQYGVGALPVLTPGEHPRLIGIVTDHDIICRIIARHGVPEQLTVGDCMTSHPITIDADTSLQECCEKMIRFKVRRLPVVDKDGSYLGLITETNIAQHAPIPMIGEFMRAVTEPISRHYTHEILAPCRS